jgi:rare lipoprotein A
MRIDSRRREIRVTVAAIALSGFVAGCGSEPRRGGYYQDDGPGGKPPVELDRVADATPRYEPLNALANEPYVVLGRRYVPYVSLHPYRQRGIASWYGRKFHGKRTSSGERYDMYAMTAAHTILPIPSYARVTNLSNGRSVVVRINDRGPFHSDRIIDLSYAAAYKLGYVKAGSARVEVEAILPERRS